MFQEIDMLICGGLARNGGGREKEMPEKETRGSKCKSESRLHRIPIGLIHSSLESDSCEQVCSVCSVQPHIPYVYIKMVVVVGNLLFKSLSVNSVI